MWDGVHLSDIGNDIFLINLQRGMSYLFYTLLFTNLFIYILVQNFFFETSLVYIVIESPGQKHVYVIAQINITLTEYTVIGWLSKETLSHLIFMIRISARGCKHARTSCYARFLFFLIKILRKNHCGSWIHMPKCLCSLEHNLPPKD